MAIKTSFNAILLGLDELRSVPNNVECVSLTQQAYLKVLTDS